MDDNRQYNNNEESNVSNDEDSDDMKTAMPTAESMRAIASENCLTPFLTKESHLWECVLQLSLISENFSRIKPNVAKLREFDRHKIRCLDVEHNVIFIKRDNYRGATRSTR
jgi:hypothetical protein